MQRVQVCGKQRDALDSPGMGEGAWADSLSGEEFAQMRLELADALKGDSAESYDEVRRSWKVTASLLRDHDLIEALLADGEPVEEVMLTRPA